MSVVEAIVELLPLLFVAAYYLLAARRRSAQRKAAQQREVIVQEEGPTDAPRAATPFQSFLEELEQAMAQASGATPEPEATSTPLPEPAPLEIVPPAPIVERPIPALGTEFRPVTGSFDGATPPAHERHGFGEENPLSEEVFERLGDDRPRRSREYDPHDLRPRRLSPTTTPSLFDRLHDPKTARDAFVLQTIFGQRGGRRGDRR